MGLFQRVALFLGLYQHMLEVGNTLSASLPFTLMMTSLIVLESIEKRVTSDLNQK